MADEPETPLTDGGDPPAPDPEPAPAPPQESAPAEDAPSEGKLKRETLLAELRASVDRGEIDAAEAAKIFSPKLQQVNSSLINKLGRFEERAARADAALAAKGVKLPEGATSIMDLFADPDHTKFVEWWENLPSNAAARETRTQLELQQLGHQKIVETVKAFPELEPHVTQICQTILEDPLMRKFSEVPEAIPLLMVGVGRDLEVQRMRPQLKDKTDQLNQALQMLKENGLAVNMRDGKSTEVKPSTPKKSEPAQPLSIKSIATAKYAEIKRQAGVH